MEVTTTQTQQDSLTLRTGQENRETLEITSNGSTVTLKISFPLKAHDTGEEFQMYVFTTFPADTAMDIMNFLKDWKPGKAYFETGVDKKEHISFCDDRMTEHGELVSVKKMRILRPSAELGKKEKVAITLITQSNAKMIVAYLEHCLHEANPAFSTFQSRIESLENTVEVLKKEIKDMQVLNSQKAEEIRELRHDLEESLEYEDEQEIQEESHQGALTVGPKGRKS